MGDAAPAGDGGKPCQSDGQRLESLTAALDLGRFACKELLQHGTHIIDHAERIGLGSRSYTLIDLADLTGIQLISSQAMPQSYNIFRIDGTPVGTNMKSLDALSEGLYIINGKKVAIK
jgi:hypothetical protein